MGRIKIWTTRKYYQLTKIGEEFLKELETTWDDLVKAVKLTRKAN